MIKKKYKPEYLILDVDGVMTTGKFLYSDKGKVMKVFGAHDSDGLKLINKFLKILFISADKRGFEITKKRIQNDLGYKLKFVTAEERYEFIKKMNFQKVAYIGDGYFDKKILKDCLYGIAPKNARVEARKNANYVTSSNSGEGAVLDACLKLISKFFN
jgi:3-deoxy-D-manno-octulosonate 8-phosphate phosphatase (KDO 8-P phosphatase)